MNLTVATTVGPTVALQWKRRVDAVCERFEDAWGEGASPKVEDYLDDPETPPARRAALLVELLKLERELREKRGEHPGAAEYLARFPSYPVVVRSIFGEDRVGEYDLIAPIGEGGMGVVYHARHRRIGREVALKMIRPYCLDDSAAVDRFRLEAQLAARLEHENIVTVYEAGLADGQHYYAMRYIVGQSLSELVGHKPIDPMRAARLMEQVARAVDFAHTNGVLHRDIKPRNILVDAQDRAYVTDFGLAKALNRAGTGATRTDDRLGTPPYMSPEQVRDPSRAGVASDIYSVGATLYECLTGRAPFTAENPLEVYRLVLDAEPASPRSLTRKCSRDIETICLKCLEKDPARRYASALQLAEDLKRFRDGLPILARRIGPFERMRKWGRKHPTGAALIASVVVVLVTLGAVVQGKRTNALIERGYKGARSTVDEFTQFGDELSDHPALRKRLWDISLRYYENLLSERGHDPALAEEMAATHTRVARLSNLLGDKDRALEAHRKALDLRRDLTRRNPGERRIRAALAETLHDIGILLNARGAIGRDEAIAAYREALEIRLALVKADPACRAFLESPTPPKLAPDDRALIGDLARSYGYIGDWEREGGLHDPALASYEKAMTLRSRLAGADPSDLIAKFQLARSENNAGILQREDRQLDAAIASQEKALALQDELVAVGEESARERLTKAFRDSRKAADFDYDDFRTDRATTLNYLGVLHAEAGRRSEAIRYHRMAAEAFEALAAEHPDLARWEVDRAWSATYLGELEGSLDLLEIGRSTFDRLVSADGPPSPRARAGLARNLYATGRLTPGEDGRALLHRALDEQDALCREQPRNFDFRRDRERTVQALKAEEGLEEHEDVSRRDAEGIAESAEKTKQFLVFSSLRSPRSPPRLCVKRLPFERRGSDRATDGLGHVVRLDP